MNRKKKPHELLRHTVTPITVRCKVCGKTDRATIFKMGPPDVPQLDATWLKLPQGWWVLTETFVTIDRLHCRCPGCLRFAQDRKPRTGPALKPEEITRATALHFGLTIGDIMGPERTQSIALARSVAMYLCRMHTEYSLPELGREFGRDHTTVRAAVLGLETRLPDPAIDAHVAAIRERLEVSNGNL